MFFSQNEITEINTLIQEGFRRLDNIESDIRTLLVESADSKNPFAETIKSALDEVCPDAQFLAIKKSRAGLRLICAKLEIEEFSDSDAEEVCRVLDEIKVVGRKLAESSQKYKRFIRQRAENN